MQNYALSVIKNLNSLAASGVFAFALLLIPSIATEACTTAVISGKATADGRPLLWKNRDRSFVHNEVTLFTEGKYRAAAVVNAGSRTSIWMGVNEAGFCIENSVTDDLKVKGAKGFGNGSFMKEALLTCATVEDFRALLEKTNKTGRATRANFGVIDAQGGAILFETSATSFVAFDANDSAVAPHGVVVRSNFSMTGRNVTQSLTPEEVSEFPSSERYLRAQALMNERLEEGLEPFYIIRNCMRDMADDTGCCVPGSVNDGEQTLPEFVATKNTISRSTTVSAAVFQGVLPGEDPRLTTMWVAIGDPKFSIAIPCWASCITLAPELGAEQNDSFTKVAQQIREAFYDKERNGITTAGLEEYWQKAWSTEDHIFNFTTRNLDRWRNSPVRAQSLTQNHHSAAANALRTLQQQEQRIATEVVR